jgi:hypothetical protein
MTSIVRTPATAMTGALEGNSAAALNPRVNKAKTEKQESRSGQLVDRFGHLHTDAVLRNWSPAAIRAMGIRPIEEGGAR